MTTTRTVSPRPRTIGRDGRLIPPYRHPSKAEIAASCDLRSAHAWGFRHCGAAVADRLRAPGTVALERGDWDAAHAAAADLWAAADYALALRGNEKPRVAPVAIVKGRAV